MRPSVAVAVLLSCAFRVSAHSPVVADNADQINGVSQWRRVYQSAIDASRQHRDEEARDLLEKSWQTAVADDERGLAADGLGQTERRLGRIEEAKQWLGRAVEAFSAVGAFRQDPKQAHRLAVAAANLSDLERTTGNYRGAEAVLQKVLNSPACDGESRGFIRNNLADLLREEGRSQEAQRLFKETLDSPGPAARARVASMIGLADIDRQRSAWESSISQWNEALDISRQEKDEAAEAIILRGLGQTWLQSGSTARAEPLLKKSLKLMETKAEMPPEEVATSHAGLAELYRAENKLALAENEWTHALEIDRPLLGETHPQVAILMEALSDVYAARGEFALARDYAAKASETMGRTFGENSIAQAAALTNQAGVEQRAGSFDAAARYFERAVSIARAHPEHRSIGITMIERYAGLLKAMHRSGEAKALLAQRNAWRENEPSPFSVK
jgi:tetratricopeptide (TPR) repeat protein